MPYQQWMPSWLNPQTTIPTATPSPQVEFMEAANRLLPQMSPYDVRPWAQYLYAQEPQVFTGYNPQTVAAWQPPRLTAQQSAAYQNPERIQQGWDTLSGMVDPDSPAREWLNTVFQTAKQYQNPTRRGQQDYYRLMGDTATGTGLLGAPTSYGVTKEQAALWQPWLQSYIAPTTERLPKNTPTNAPSWITSSAMLGQPTTTRRASSWGNSRWL
jgi:hypothetical protein